jgi:cytoplasmic iron level regulating protein YaaA (DUF328/UPF0246 family)
MLFLLSPAKSLDYETPIGKLPHSLPGFVEQSSELIDLLRKRSPQQIAQLMDLSDKLASLNVARYEAWRPKFSAANSRQALLAFNGDVYEGLDAKTLKPEQLDWAQEHLCILSGLYGVLRPLDWMQPYRLEMGTALPNARGKNLYHFWGPQLAQYLNERVAAQGQAGPIVNLASEEYFKAVDLKALQVPVVQCVFEEFKAGKYKIISFMAKRARGLMARYAIEKKISTVKKLQGFDREGYAIAPEASQEHRLVFRRSTGSP